MTITKTCGCVTVTLDCDKLGVPPGAPGLETHVEDIARIGNTAFTTAKRFPHMIPKIDAVIDDTRFELSEL